ncbi:MAG: fused response regulator/phosphatase [Clostridiales bacterium]|jgi:sigma-B regulation protein RsbU (phosphoserine phosphatase)|nr:fused response regulator/phosphatase [Clostridiales bacterium]
MFNIIVADLNAVNANLIAGCIQNLEYNIMVSESGANVIAKCRMFSPDLVIASTELCDMSGYDLCKTIKRGENTADCLVLLLSNVETRETSLKALQAGADDFMDKHFDALILQAKVKSLLRVKTLGNQLKEKYKELEEKNAVLSMQLEMSKKVQTSLVQKPDMLIGDAAISNVYLPAIAIGGDFYDIIPIDKDRAAIIMGDVSGHGISSALITTMVLIMVRNLSEYYESPDELLYYLNNQFIDAFGGKDSEIYICVLAAFLDTKNNEITYANAGLTPPLYADSETRVVKELHAAGMPVGMVKGVKYDKQSLNYSGKDRLLFYTDGLADTFYKRAPEEFVKLMSEILLCDINEADSKKLLNIILDEFYIKEANENNRFGLDDVCVILCQL